MAGPGRGGVPEGLPDELKLVVDKHVAYIQSLDTVRQHLLPLHLPTHPDTDFSKSCSEKMSSNITSQNISASQGSTGAFKPSTSSLNRKPSPDKAFLTSPSLVYTTMEASAPHPVMMRTCSTQSPPSKSSP